MLVSWFFTTFANDIDKVEPNGIGTAWKQEADTSIIRTAEAKGRAEGRAERQQKEKVETVRRLSLMGLTLEQIAIGANLTKEEVVSILIVSFGEAQIITAFMTL